MNKIKKNFDHGFKFVISFMIGMIFVTLTPYSDIPLIELLSPEIQVMTVGMVVEGIRNYLKHAWGFKIY